MRSAMRSMPSRGNTRPRSFGSVARKEERPDSDVDFLVELPPRMSYFGLCDFADDLRGVLGRSVEIVSHKALETSPCFAYNVKKDMLPV